MFEDGGSGCSCGKGSTRVTHEPQYLIHVGTRPESMTHATSMAPDKLSIRSILAEDTASIRHQVLWPSIPIELQLLPFDSLSTTRHCGAFQTTQTDAGSADTPGKLVACLTVTLESYERPDRLPPSIRQGLYSESPDQAPQYQLHKFAVLPDCQGRGIGKALLYSALQSLIVQVRQDGGRAFLFHFDARTTQLDMYRHLGFEVLDEERFMKYGSTGKEPGVEYVRMGRVVDCAQ